MTDELGWYAVRFLLESLHPGEAEAPRFFEERILVVRADDEDEAREKAVAHARSQEDEYENALGNTVKVVFREVLDVQDILGDDITDLTEVYYHFLNADEVDQIRKSLEPGSADERWPATARPARA
jgi:hypothetical protein